MVFGVFSNGFGGFPMVFGGFSNGFGGFPMVFGGFSDGFKALVGYKHVAACVSKVTTQVNNHLKTSKTNPEFVNI